MGPCYAVRHGKIQSLRPLAGRYDSFCSLIYMAAVSLLASAAYTQQRQQQQSRRQHPEVQRPEKQRRWSQFRLVKIFSHILCCSNAAAAAAHRQHDDKCCKHAFQDKPP